MKIIFLQTSLINHYQKESFPILTGPPVLNSISTHTHTHTQTHVHARARTHTQNRLRYNSPLLAPQVKFFHSLPFIYIWPPGHPPLPVALAGGTGQHRALPIHTPPADTRTHTHTHTHTHIHTHTHTPWSRLLVFPSLEQLPLLCLEITAEIKGFLLAIV